MWKCVRTSDAKERAWTGSTTFNLWALIPHLRLPPLDLFPRNISKNKGCVSFRSSCRQNWELNSPAALRLPQHRQKVKQDPAYTTAHIIRAMRWKTRRDQKGHCRAGMRKAKDLHCYGDRWTHNNKWFLTVILFSEETSFLWLKITLKFEPTCQSLNEEADLSFIEQPSSTRSSMKHTSWGALPPIPPASAFPKRIFVNLPFSARIGYNSIFFLRSGPRFE